MVLASKINTKKRSLVFFNDFTEEIMKVLE